MTLSPVTKAALVLGLLSAVGPFAIDMFLPALPAIAEDLGASVTATQGTMTFYFVAFGLAQMLYGPWSDQSGRKTPIYAGLLIFMVGSIGATLAPSIDLLIAARAIQAIGAASLMVVTRAIIRDQFTGYEATRLMSLIILVFSVSPMFAPLTGAAFVDTLGWRAIFATLTIAAVLALLLTIFFQPETLKPENRVRVDFAQMRQGMGLLFRDPVFMGLTFIGSFAMAGFFVFISSAAFVYEASFNLTPTQFSLAFTVNAMGFIGASQSSAPLMKRFGALALVGIGTAGFTAVLVTLSVLAALGLATLPVLICGLAIGFAFVGIILPTTMVASLDPHGEIAGLASSLGGTLQMVAGGLVVALAGPFFDGTPLPMIVAMACCAFISLILYFAIRRPAGRDLAQNA